VSALGLGFPLEGERVRLESDRPDSAAVIVRLSDSARVGTIVFETAHTTLTVQSFCIDAAARSYGCGSEAAWLFVRAAKASGYERVRAWAPPTLGLAVYFWFRMGFHPLHGEGPEGGIWLELELG
jgi:hypothetical protein